ncbi:MAG: DUF1835 domain-containing protein, partial [Gelidibacter sp.]|nr:DUF1835 domain-containing protein [Gelidibacter sp.]
AEELIDSEAFFKNRKAFLNDFYDIEVNDDELKSEIQSLNHTESYSEIVLWFEYDLFCHINLIAVISLLAQKNVQLPLYLVCSGRVEDEKDLKALSELTPNQLLAHYHKKIKLKTEDIDLAKTLWTIYCGKDHNLFTPYVVKKSSFIYLSNCLKAHINRFPDSKTGLSALEQNILEIIKKYPIKSRLHLLGYALNYQGYYGYSDMQMMRLINQLSIFFAENEDSLKLNRKGYEALLGHHNLASELNINMTFGGIQKTDYLYNATENKLIKTIINAY